MGTIDFVTHEQANSTNNLCIPTSAAFYPETGLFGVTAEDGAFLVKELRDRLGDLFLGAVVIGSRAAGRSSHRPTTEGVQLFTDLDVIVFLTDRALDPEVMAMKQVALSYEERTGVELQLMSLSPDVVREPVRVGLSLCIPMGEGFSSYAVIEKSLPPQERNLLVAVPLLS